MSVGLRSFINGTSVRVEAQIQDFDSTPDNPIYIDPTSNSLKIYDDDGAVVMTLTTTIVRDGVGLYHVDFQISAGTLYEIGKWRGDWTATYGSLPSIGRVYFNVVS